MAENKIDSNESEGAFNDFIEDKINDLIDGILNDGDFDNIGGRGSDIIVEADDIVTPVFEYGDGGEGGAFGIPVR